MDFLFICLTQNLMVFMSIKVLTSAGYFLDLLWADGKGHAHTINRNRKNRRETNGAGRIAPKGTLNTSLELEEQCFHNSSLCLRFLFFLSGNRVNILALKKIQDDFGTITHRNSLPY